MKPREPRSNGDTRTSDAGSLIGYGQLLTDKALALSVWAGLIGLALIALLVSRGTSYHQLAIGILVATVLLFLLLLLVEIVWTGLVSIFGVHSRKRAG